MKMSITRRIAALVAVALVTVGSTGARAASAISVANPELLWLEKELTANGGSLPSSFDPASPDWGLTLDAVLALRLGGRGAEQEATATTGAFATHVNDYITGEAFGDAGSFYAGPIGKALLTATVQGANVHTFGGVDLEALSRSRLQTSGMFTGRFSDTSTFGDYSNGFGQALNVLALSYTATGVPAIAATFLLAQQCPAGGFRLFYDAIAPAVSTPGCTSDAEADTDATSLAISALLTVAPTTVRITAVQKATTWLLAQQSATSGGFKGTGPTAAPNANSTALAVRALRAVGQGAATTRGLTYLASLQLPIGPAASTVVGDEGAIAQNKGALDDAIANGIDAAARDPWRRATTQAAMAISSADLGVPNGGIVTVPAARLLDTRSNVAVAAGETVTLTVAAKGGVPEDASAVVLNVAAVDGADAGYITVYACDETRPATSNVNFAADTAIANVVISKVSAAGTVCLYVGDSSVHLLTDVNGFFPAGSSYQTVAPTRLLDTRSFGGASVAGTVITVPVAGRAAVPSGVGAVVLNVTALDGADPGFVTVYACDETRPVTSNVNFAADAAVANVVVSKLSAAGTVCLYIGDSSVHLLTDVNGFFPAGSSYHALPASRLADSRAGEPLSAGSTTTVAVSGRSGVPSGATSVILNVTAVGGSGDGYVTVYPCDAPRPVASNVNFGTDVASANVVVSALSATGSVCLYVGDGSVHLISDVSGYFA
jgi:hypothetical protein